MSRSLAFQLQKRQAAGLRQAIAANFGGSAPKLIAQGKAMSARAEQPQFDTIFAECSRPLDGEHVPSGDSHLKPALTDCHGLNVTAIDPAIRTGNPQRFPAKPQPRHVV